jgi:hypothetical protein
MAAVAAKSKDTKPTGGPLDERVVYLADVLEPSWVGAHQPHWPNEHSTRPAPFRACLLAILNPAALMRHRAAFGQGNLLRTGGVARAAAFAAMLTYSGRHVEEK